MGYDVSYHPITEEQIHKLYFNVIEDINLTDSLKVRVPSCQLKDESQRDEIEKFYLDKYKETIKTSIKMKDEDFGTSHAFNIAVVQGFFEEFFYTRGSALSFLDNDSFFKKYTTSWTKFVNSKYLNNYYGDKLNTNHSGGVFISPSQVSLILQDYDVDLDLKNTLDKLFSHKRIDVFLAALSYAKERNLGLLEATDVVEPHPDYYGEHVCYSNLFNCDPSGITLYQLAVRDQIEKMSKEDEL